VANVSANAKSHLKRRGGDAALGEKNNEKKKKNNPAFPCTLSLSIVKSAWQKEAAP